MKVTVVGASGYVGGELLRLLSMHPDVDEIVATSERLAGKFVKIAHPNLRRMNLKFSSAKDLGSTDVILSCLPHGRSFGYISRFLEVSDRIVDLSADFRLNSADAYREFYGQPHLLPDMLDSFVYGIPELHREEMRSSRFISSAGCNATASILPLAPLINGGFITENITIDAKVGVSEAGRQSTESSSFVERDRSLRSYQLTGHRHLAEITQELSLNFEPRFSATSIPTVRGVLVTIQVEPVRTLTDKDLWKIYRDAYGGEYFIDIVKERHGNFRYPDPKTLMGSNTCQIGFEVDERTDRVVIVSALDNLMKGAAGQAIQGLNIMMGLEETTGLEAPGFYIY